MNISICITTLNEEGTIGSLLDSLLAQSKKPDEIVIVDGGSKDKTVEIIRHYQKKDGRIKLLIEKSSRAKGRNLGVEIAKGEVVAMTDAGCVADKDWIKNITEPFKMNQNADPQHQKFGVGVNVVAGFYKMTGDSRLQKAESVFLGVTPRRFDVKFLPSTRSIAFRKSVWEKIGGFPERLPGTAEDTIFNLNLIKSEAKFSRMKNAVVEWGMPQDLEAFYFKIFNYAKGDAKSKILFFPGKGLTSHNIKALFVVFRYLIGILLLILSFWSPLVPYLLICVFAYLIYSFRKVFIEFGDWKVALWGPVLQITSDIAVMVGFLSGIFKNA